MSLGALMREKERSSQVHMPKDIDWQMLDKSRFFFLGAALFSGVSTALYPIVVLKTRQQVSTTRVSCTNISLAIARHEGLRGFYKGFGTSLLGTIPARALYMSALEITKSRVGQACVMLGLSDTTSMAVANGAAGLTSAVAAQIIWTPIDVVSQRLMVQGDLSLNPCRYTNGFDAFRKILYTDGPRGFYRGFGISILTYAPSNAVWWASYSLAQKSIWSRFKRSYGRKEDTTGSMMVQGVSAAMASGCSALITMPIDTIKTRLQVLRHRREREKTSNDSDAVSEELNEGRRIWGLLQRVRTKVGLNVNVRNNNDHNLRILEAPCHKEAEMIYAKTFIVSVSLFLVLKMKKRNDKANQKL